MVDASSASASLKEYLKRYQNTDEDDKKKKKKKKKQPRSDVTGVIVVDEDPTWQKPVNLEEEENDDDEDKPQIDEEIEVKRMKRLEQLKARRPFGVISDDGSGWVSISDAPKALSSNPQSPDISPPQKRSARNGTPSPEPEPKPVGQLDADLSPPRQRRRHYDTSYPEHETESSHLESKHLSSRDQNVDISPPRKRRALYDTPSPRDQSRALESSREIAHLPPPHQRQSHHYTAKSPTPDPDLSPPHRSRPQNLYKYERKMSKTPDLPDISPPRRADRSSSYQYDSHTFPGAALSHPRRSRNDRHRLDVISPDNLHPSSTGLDDSHASSISDLSPPRKRRSKELTAVNEQPKTGLVTGKDVKEEIFKTKKEDWRRFQEMDPSISGWNAEPVYRDKITGQRMSKEQILKSQKKEEKPKEIKLEWGKGLAQKREAEERLMELEIEKDRPFARTRDDPELDRMLKDRVRWGDPMAHLVKKKIPETILPDLGDDENMKSSGFVIPQEIPNHSWIKRCLDAAPNRYGIKPGRHWDGVDRSNGFEKQLFKRLNEKRATETEAYLWSVSDM